MIRRVRTGPACELNAVELLDMVTGKVNSSVTLLRNPPVFIDKHLLYILLTV